MAFDCFSLENCHFLYIAVFAASDEGWDIRSIVLIYVFGSGFMFVIGLIQGRCFQFYLFFGVQKWNFPSFVWFCLG